MKIYQLSFSRLAMCLAGLLALAGVALLFVLIFGDLAFAQRSDPWGRYGSFYPETTHWRILLVLGSGAAGFGLGWFCSPYAKTFRAFIVLGLATLMGLVVLLDNGPIGWTLAMALAWVVFTISFGYWMRGIVARLSERPTTFGSAAWAKREELEAATVLSGTNGFRLGHFTDDQGVLPLIYKGDRTC